MTDIKLPIDPTFGMSPAERAEFLLVNETMAKHSRQLDELDRTNPSPELIEATPALGLLSMRHAIQSENVVPLDFARRRRLQ